MLTLLPRPRETPTAFGARAPGRQEAEHGDLLEVRRRDERGRTLLDNRFILVNVGSAILALMAILAESVLVAWDEVLGLRPHTDRHVVTLRRRFLPDLHVFCTPGNFVEVASYTTRMIRMEDRP